MTSVFASFSPRRQNRRGFVVAAVLYLLGLIGVIGGILYSGNMQSIRSVLGIQNSLTIRSDLQAATNTLSAEAVFSTDNQTLCPPRSTHEAGGNPCASAPIALMQFGDLATNDPHLAANHGIAGSSGSPVEVGVFPAGAGMKQLDAYGHYYIYCRWENPRSAPAAPAFALLSAGPDGNLQTRCGDSQAQGDDSYTMLTVGDAINRAALWQSDASNNVSYGAVGSKVTIDSNGDLNAAGNITAGGALAGQNAAIANGITASTLTTTGNITGGTGSFGDISGSSLEISGAATVIGTTTIGVLNAQASTLDSLTVTHDATIGGGLTVQGGDVVIPNGYSYAQIDSTGNARRLIALSPENDILLGGHNGTGNIYFLTNNSTVGYVDVAGDLDMTGNIVGVNGNFSGNSTATNFTASSTVTGITGNFQNLNANSLTAGNTTISGTLSVTGQTTGSSASYTGTVTAASFNGTMTLGGSGGVTISGILPIANGGTGASSAAIALNNLGVTSGGVFNTGLLTPGLINGGYLTSGTVTSIQLNATGVAAGNCPLPTVGSDGRITACGTSVTATAAGSTGDIQFNNSSSFSASNGLYWDNTHGYLGIGTSSPSGILDVEGGKAAASASGTNIKLAAQSGGTGNSNGGNIYLTPGTGSGTGYAGSVLIGSTCSSLSWLAFGLCASGDILSQTGFATPSFQPYGWGTSSAQLTGVGGGTTGDQIRFITNSIERARFDGSGHFAIGTINPVNALDVSGGVAIGVFYAGTNAAPANGLIVQGNVGIGTKSPQAILDVTGNGSGSFPNSNGSLSQFSIPNGNYWATVYQDLSNSNRNYDIGISSWGTSDGKLGIVQVNSLEGITFIPAAVAGTNADDVLAINANLEVVNTAWSSVYLFVNDVTGNTGLGTSSPASTLSVNGGVAIGTTYAAANAAGSNNLIVQGNVGIGTTSPAATLDINGFMRLAKNSSAPATCSATNEDSLALTSQHTLCVCNGTAWAAASDGLTACAWTASSSPIQIVLTTAGTGTWTVPANWNSSNNKIEVVGAGAGGASFNITSAGSVGGGGGAYSNVTNLALTPGTTINYTIGTAGAGETGSAAAQNGGDTWFNATSYASASVAAKGGSAVSNGNTGGIGGAASSGIGTTKYSGGNGGNSGTNNAGAGGGSAAGPDGNGVIGVTGASGSSSTGGAGGTGDNGNGGAGGIGGTSASKAGGTGSPSAISGGGGGGGYASSGNGGVGGAAGAGGGGGGSGSNSTLGGQGANGEIVITYTP